MSKQGRAEDLKDLYTAWDKHPGDNLCSSLARVMQDYGLDAWFLKGGEAYLDVSEDKRILVINLSDDTQFIFPMHKYPLCDGEQLLEDIAYMIPNYY